MLSRRAFMRNLIVTAAGLAVPAPLAAVADTEPMRRLWALDGAMLSPAGVTAPRVRSIGEASCTLTLDSAQLGEQLRAIRVFSSSAARSIAMVGEAEYVLEQLPQFGPPSHDAIIDFSPLIGVTGYGFITTKARPASIRSRPWPPLRPSPA